MNQDPRKRENRGFTWWCTTSLQTQLDWAPNASQSLPNTTRIPFLRFHELSVKSESESHKPTLIFSFALVSTKAALFSLASFSPLAASTWRLCEHWHRSVPSSNKPKETKYDWWSNSMRTLVHRLWWRIRMRRDPPRRRKITFRPYDDARNVTHTTEVDNLVIYNLYHIERAPWCNWVYEDITMDTNGILWVDGWIFVLNMQ